MKALGKMTIATLGTKPKVITVMSDKQLADNKNRAFLARIMGTARNTKMAIDTNGNPVFGLTGEFLAQVTDPDNGTVEEYTSGVLYLPGGLQELVQSPLEKAIDEAGGKSVGISFAMDLFSVKATNKAGYSFAADLAGDKDPTVADPFAAQRAMFGEAKLPALPNLSAAQTDEAAKAQADQAEKARLENEAKEAAKTPAKS